MNTSIYNISLDLHEQISPKALYVKRGDTVRELRVTITEDGKPYEVTSDVTSILCAILPTGSTVETAMTRDGNILTAVLPSSWTATDGEVRCDVSLSSGSDSLRTPGFSIFVGHESGSIPTDARELPAITSADNGKVLTATDGVWDKAFPLPEVTSADDGKVLSARNGSYEATGLFEYVNLYNVAANTANAYIDASGNIVSYEGRSLTEYIYLAPGTYWISRHNGVIDGFDYIGYYNTGKEFQSRAQLSDNTITVENECYVRLFGSTTKIAKSMIVRGDTDPVTFIPYKPTIKNDVLYNVDGSRIANGSTPIIKADYISYADNLINHMTVAEGKVISAQGEISDSSQYAITGKMYLEPGGTYSYRNVLRVVYFDASDTRVGYSPCSERTGEYDEGMFTVNTECYYAIAALKLASSINKEWQIVAGNTLPEDYSQQHLVIDGYRIYDGTADVHIDGEELTNGSVRPQKTSFISYADNLINRMTVTEGEVISAQGEITENRQYAITDKIYLEPGETYSYRNIVRVVYFDKTDTRVGYSPCGERGSGYETGTFTANSKGLYAIAALKLAATVNKEWQIVKGDTLPENYSPQHLVIDGYRIYDEPDVPVYPLQIMKEWDKVVIDKAPVYLRTTDTSALSSSDLSVSAIYAAYDALMAANPDYITKTELGPDTHDETTLYRYDFATPEYTSGNPGTTPSSNRKSKMILISGVHPEWAGVYGLYHALERITNDPALIDIKAQMHFIVMPMVNAYGCDHNQRKNYNGIDLARNFEIGFVAGSDPSSDTYAGTEPLSEVEDQYVDALMSENADAIYFASCHNFQSASGHPNWNIWACSATKYYSNVGAKVIDKMTEAWRNKYNYTDDAFGQSEVAAPNGSEGKQAMKYGLQGGTFEVCAYFNAEEENVKYSASAISRASEVYVNMIRTAMYCYDRTDKRLD